MLSIFRKNTKTIVWVVVFAFVLWGGFSASTQFKKQGRFAGEVFGRGVTHQEFGRFYRAAQIFSFGAEKPESDEAIRSLAWQSLIFSREAHERGIKVTDEET